MKLWADVICSSGIQADKAASGESWDSCLLLTGVSSLHREKLSKKELQGSRGQTQVRSQMQPSHCLQVCSGERTPDRAGTLQRLPGLNKADQLAGRGRLQNQLLTCLDFCQVCRNKEQQTAEVPHVCGNRCWKAESLCAVEPALLGLESDDLFQNSLLALYAVVCFLCLHPLCLDPKPWD